MWISSLVLILDITAEFIYLFYKINARNRALCHVCNLNEETLFTVCPKSDVDRHLILMLEISVRVCAKSS